jgi:heme-degrading monooxygenase HmoA
VKFEATAADRRDRSGQVVPRIGSNRISQRKEDGMAVKVYIKRKIKSGKGKEAGRLLVKARSAAMVQDGYISSENLTSCTDPNTLMVVSIWENEDNWQRWKDSAARKAIENEFADLLAAPAEYDIYHMGFNL